MVKASPNPRCPVLFNLVWEGWIESESNGNLKSYELPARQRGRMVKVVHYDVVVVQSTGDNVRLSFELKHGPDGVAKTAHSTLMSSVNPGTAYPALVSGDADATKILSEWLPPIVKIADSAAPSGNTQRAYVRVYEMRKPF